MCNLFLNCQCVSYIYQRRIQNPAEQSTVDVQLDSKHASVTGKATHDKTSRTTDWDITILFM